VDFVISEEIFGFVAQAGLGEDGFAALVVEAVVEVQAEGVFFRNNLDQPNLSFTSS
jgi:hypothetical protein